MGPGLKMVQRVENCVVSELVMSRQQSWHKMLVCYLAKVSGLNAVDECDDVNNVVAQ